MMHPLGGCPLGSCPRAGQPAARRFARPPVRSPGPAPVLGPVLAVAWTLAWTLAWASHAAPNLVTGVADRTVLADRVTFSVAAEAGHETTATLNGTAIAVGAPVTVTAPDYYELRVARRAQATGALEEQRVQFIVRASARGDSEWGLRPWTPYTAIPSHPAELGTAPLLVRLPARVPAGMEVPVVILAGGQGRDAVRVNGWVTSERHAPILLRRGVGSGALRPFAVGGAQSYAAQAFGRELTLPVDVVATPDWQTAAGALAGPTVWTGFIDVTHTVTVPTGGRLEVQPATVVRLHAGADLVVEGTVTILGEAQRPVLFAARDRAQPWGGFIVATNTARLEAHHAFFVGSGAHPRWFDDHPGYDVHRHEQALFLIDGAEALLDGCYALDGHGQFGHGRHARLTLTNCVVQRFLTGGEYAGGAVHVADSALLEFPADDGVFADEDNDAIYFTAGTHRLEGTLIGWAKDDGIDAGSGGAGTVTVRDCWIDSCFHEGLAWSGEGRVTDTRDTVVLNCGQGLECGWSSGADSPRCFAERLLALGNLIGARFGDNYDWTYNGFLQLTNAFLLFNHRDVWGLNWDDWTYRTAQMDLRSNVLTRLEALHPDNAAYDPARDAPRLAAFLTTVPEAPVGLGFATRTAASASAAWPADGLPVRLSSFSAHPAAVDYLLETPTATLGRGTLTFRPGETVHPIPRPPLANLDFPVVRLRLTAPQQAAVTGRDRFYLERLAEPPSTPLIATGSVWRYFDAGVDQGTAWRALEFDDASWPAGAAELGFGDDDETTRIDGGPSTNRHPTTYFRHAFTVPAGVPLGRVLVRVRRDDGAAVYLNGDEILRSNLPEGTLAYTNLALAAASSETAFYSNVVSAARLRPGLNVVAAEVHQASATSSDLSFELELLGLPPPRLELRRWDDELLLFWAPGADVLETASDPAGPWTALEADESPRTILPLQREQFFRLAY